MSDAKLKSLAERIERLMDERDDIQSDIRDIYTEAKSVGYVPKVLRKAITRKRMDPSKRDEEDAILDLYETALSPQQRKAVAMAAQGATSREIEQATGIDHATVARSVALNKKPETVESCGGVESRHAGYIEEPANGLRRSEPQVRVGPEPSRANKDAEPGLEVATEKTPGSRLSSGSPDAPAAGVAPGPQDPDDDGLEIPPFLRRSAA